MKQLLLTAFALSALPSVLSARTSDVICYDHAQMTKNLKQDLGAERLGTGLRDPETLFEVWVITRNGDWLAVQNYANGTSCIVAMGEHWQGAPKGPA